MIAFFCALVGVVAFAAVVAYSLVQAVDWLVERFL